MATKILLKKSVTGGASPLTADLDQGELAINLVDRKIYTKDSGNNIKAITGAYVDSSAPANPVEGDIWYDTTNNLLKAHNGTAFVSAGYQNLSALEDVTITSIASGEILKWNGSAFINNTLAEAGIAATGHTHTLVEGATDVTASAAELNKLDGVTATTAELNKISGLTATTTELNYVGSVTSAIQAQLNTKLENITSETLTNLSDVAITGTPADNEVVAYDLTAGKFINQTAAEAGLAAASHNHSASEITSGTLANARISQASVTQHESNLTITESQISDLGSYITGYTVTESDVTGHQAALSITESQISDLGSYITDVSGDDLDDLSNVTITSNSNGELLVWNGTAWVNQTAAEAGLVATSHTHTASDITDFTSEVRGDISVADVGGDGSLAYNSTSGVITYTGPSAAEARAHFSAGTGVGISSGQISIGQDVGTTDDVVFGKVTSNSMEHTGTITLNPNSGGAANEGVVVIAGDLTVNGTTTSVNSNEVNIGDSIVLLNSDETGTPSQNGGIEIERGTSANVQFVWNESDTAWDLDNEELQNVTLDGGTY